MNFSLIFLIFFVSFFIWLPIFRLIIKKFERIKKMHNFYKSIIYILFVLIVSICISYPILKLIKIIYSEMF